MTDPKILIPVIRQALPAIVASDIVGVQPMSSNTGGIFSIRGKQEITWQQYLQHLSRQYTSWIKLGQQCEGDGIADINELMQQKFPGPYIIREQYNVERGLFEVEMKFEDKNQELLWKIKWSS